MWSNFPFFSRKNTQLRESTFPKLTMSPSPLNSAKRYNFNFKASFSTTYHKAFALSRRRKNGIKEWELNSILINSYLKLVVLTVYSLMYDHWAPGQIGGCKSNPLRSSHKCHVVESSKHCLLKSVSMSCQPLFQFCFFSIVICNDEFYTI